MNDEARYSKKRKIRGLKNKAACVERWRRAELTPDWEKFERNGYLSSLITAGPWDFRLPRQPPIRLVRQIIHGLLDVYEEWSAFARPEVDDLLIMLRWPELTKSSVKMVSASQRPFYDELSRFTAEGEGLMKRGFPAKFGLELLERLLGQYHWQECLSSYLSPILKGGDVSLYDETRRYWIGRRLSSVSLNSGPLP
ncbi:hypothetical protein [Deinococcus sp.]|uniref:hypothetical protein n=1 Tax=Deinococcus sp. TaxID=47478 RepID=UPI0025E5BBAC|nr:hypothetical protein [Deinococcus sp.]